MEHEPQDQKNTPDSGNPNAVNISRRNFSRLGAATPILLSLASPSVLGAPCLSNMMSGHLYQDRGECSFGWSPGGWKNPGGSEPDWNSTPFVYGTYDPARSYTKQNGTTQVCGTNKQNEHECYAGGTTLAQALGFYGLAVPTALLSLSGYSLVAILNDNTGNSTGNFAGHFVAALLNASHSGITYVLTPAQLVEIYNDPSKIPEPYTGNIGSFLDSTWN